MDQADTEVGRMIDPWWVAGLHFDNMLKKREQLVQVSFIPTTKSTVGPLRLYIRLQQPCFICQSQSQRPNHFF